MKTIHKYPLVITDHQILTIPKDSKILSIQTQNGIPCIWILMEQLKTDLIEIGVWMYGTGHDIYSVDNKTFIGTIQVNNGLLVFHVFVDNY